MEDPNNNASLVAADIMIADKLYTCTSETNLDTVIDTMSRKNYTHVPVVNKYTGAVDGFFSEKTVLDLVANGYKAIFERATQICDVSHYTSLSQVCREKFYGFITEETSFDEMVALFTMNDEADTRLDMLVVTDDGTSRGRLIGIVTPWDIFYKK